MYLIVSFPCVLYSLEVYNSNNVMPEDKKFQEQV